MEKKWQNYWKQHAVYRWDPTLSRDETFVIDTPPPTVSGLLHMGHIFSYTQADFIARFQRMRGKTVFYPIGFDDNGLPTERLVEKTRNVRATQMERHAFVALCKEVVTEAEDAYRDLFSTIALSVDWTQEYQTINPRVQALSQASFLDLAEKNQAYRSMQPVLWDVVDQTALAQVDVEDKEKEGEMLGVQFHLLDEAGNPSETPTTQVIIATTRPEYLPACVAVLCHPEDPRYLSLIGRSVATPLFEVQVPIIADTAVDPEKGTGLVMCCTFGDITDVSWWREHRLPTRMIMGKNGRLCGMEGIGQGDWASLQPAQARHWAELLTGKTIFEAKNTLTEALDAAGLLVSREKLLRPVKCAERSGAPLEIVLSPQWFVRIIDHKEALLAKANQCEWHPETMKKRLEQWIQGVSWDWCISRQRFFGVPIPVWYSKRAGEEGRVLFPALEDLPVDPLKDLPRGYAREEVEPDCDVMDTWATSSITPQLSSHGVHPGFVLDPVRHAKLFPADLRPQAHEIIRSWAFYTLVKAHLHEDTIPWKHLMISGWCLASDKTKMSKSKGNVVTPAALIEEKSADVVRYWAATSRLGADIAYSEEIFKIGKKLLTKLSNAAKFAALHFVHIASPPQTHPLTASVAIAQGQISATLDLWLLSRLHATIVTATREFEAFEYSLARIAIEDFFWNDFCDHYLEMVKVRVYNEAGMNGPGQRSAALTLYYTTDALLKLFAPILPHITEELYATLFPDAHAAMISIHARGHRQGEPARASWPLADEFLTHADALIQGSHACEIVALVRKYKAEQNLSLKTPIATMQIWQHREQDTAAKVTHFSPSILEDLKSVSNAETLQLLNHPPEETMLQKISGADFTIFVG